MVVPSPASSLVLLATSWIKLVRGRNGFGQRRWFWLPSARLRRQLGWEGKGGGAYRAPKFSNLSLRVMLLATVTPSLVIWDGGSKG